MTLVELLAAIVIGGILLAMAAMSQGRFTPHWQLSRASRQVASDLQLVRAKAVSQNTAFRVTFDVSNEVYFVERDNGSGGWDHYALFGRGAGAISGSQVDRLLPDSTELAGGSNVVVTFTPRGSVNAVATISVEHPGLNANRAVSVNFAGVVSVG